MQTNPDATTNTTLNIFLLSCSKALVIVLCHCYQVLFKHLDSLPLAISPHFGSRCQYLHIIHYRTSSCLQIINLSIILSLTSSVSTLTLLLSTSSQMTEETTWTNPLTRKLTCQSTVYKLCGALSRGGAKLEQCHNPHQLLSSLDNTANVYK